MDPGQPWRPPPPCAGEGIEEDKKPLALSVTLRPTKKTLTDPEIEAVAKKIVAGVEKATGGTLRA